MKKIIFPLLGVLSLAGCGGGDSDTSASGGGANDNTQVAVPANSASRAMDGQEVALAALPAAVDLQQPQWGALNAVYKDAHTWHEFTTDQVTVTDKGDVYIAWLSRRQGDTVDGVTDVWVRQYSAKEERWLSGTVLAVVPNTAEGRIHDVQVTNVGNEVFVAWDFGVSRTDFGMHLIPSTTMVKPAKLYFSRRDQGEGPWSVGAPIPGTANRPVGALFGWKVAPVGDQKLGVFWFASGGLFSTAQPFYMASLYSVSGQTWGPAQELAKTEKRDMFQMDSFVTVFNRQGAGMVSFDRNARQTPLFRAGKESADTAGVPCGGE